ncbi:hypothetical protein Q0F98_38110 [Paenibacillus amylolyticus]|nr:hypothetical protein Q0F98_38110 [Paenibacillus amylolyticus]
MKDSLTSEPGEGINEYKFDFGSWRSRRIHQSRCQKSVHRRQWVHGFANTALTKDENRETGDLLKEDFTRVNGTSFLVEMEPMNYRVTMTIGDAEESTSANVVVEQMTKLPLTSIAKGEFKEITYDIALIDGVFNFNFT